MDEENPNQSGMAPDDGTYAVNPMSVLGEWKKHGLSLTDDLMLARAAVEELRERLSSAHSELRFERRRYEALNEKLNQQESFAVDQQMLLDRYKALHGDLPPEPEEPELDAESVIRDIAENGVGEPEAVANIDVRGLTPRRQGPRRVGRAE